MSIPFSIFLCAKYDWASCSTSTRFSCRRVEDRVMLETDSDWNEDQVRCRVRLIISIASSYRRCSMYFLVSCWMREMVEASIVFDWLESCSLSRSC